MAFILLHSGPAGDDWLTAWHLEPLLSVLLLGAAIAYWLAFAAARRTGRTGPPVWWAVSFFAGLGCLAIALMGPPSHFNGAAFSAHMVQHMLLVQVAAPLLLLGRPVQVLLRGLPPRTSRALLRATVGQAPIRLFLAVLVSPIVVTVLFNAALLVWHEPKLYEAAIKDPLLHELEHASFFVSALLFWWVLIDPVPRSHRLSASAALLVLFATWMASDLLGAALTLAGDPLYPYYASMASPWGLTALEDQRLGGLIMWIGGGGFFAVVMIAILAVPYLRARREQTQPAR
ncbi:MAG: cytochrome c oxidase assembly protein [Dehalococcoidia bacterium]